MTQVEGEADVLRTEAELVRTSGPGPKNRGRAKPPKRRGKPGYVAKSNAVNLTVYDVHGKPLPKAFVEELVELVNQKAVDNELTFSYTTT